MEYFSISPMMLFPGTIGRFSVYLKRDNKYVLYTGDDEPITTEHRQRLYDSNVKQIYIATDEKIEFHEYAKEHLANILEDANISLDDRSEVFYEVATHTIKTVFDRKLPKELLTDSFVEELQNIIDTTLSFMQSDDALKSIGGLMKHDFSTYDHCINVFVFSLSLLKKIGYTDIELRKLAPGIMIHDIGKLNVDSTIIRKKGALEEDEWGIIKEHPLYGVSLCANIPLHQEALNCILYHHERLDGSGYPCGLIGDNIPEYVRAVSICDIYDALTSTRPYGKTYEPFKALELMNTEMRGQIDLKLYKEFIEILSGSLLKK